LTRKAGKGTIVEAELKLGIYDDKEINKFMEGKAILFMVINGVNFGKLTKKENHYSLSHVQTKALVKALSGVSMILFKGDGIQWQLSDKGATAVLLKMDDFQKRLGTTGALIKKGNASEANVLRAKSVPIIKKPNLSAQFGAEKQISKTASALVLNILKQSLSKDEHIDYCPMVRENHKDSEIITVYPLNAHRTLVSVMCWRGAYNAGRGFWLMDNKLKNIHKRITFSAVHYDNGTISENHKSRGLGDCWSGSSWAWDGKSFNLAEEYTTGMCKLIEAGGAWMLPTTVSKIQ